MKVNSYLQALLFAFVILGLHGCGGGTSGSGIKTYEGKVLSVNGGAISGVNVTIESTGESSVTDADGTFTIKSAAFGAEVVFILESSEFENRFVITDIPEASSRITLDVTVNEEAHTVEVNNIHVRAWFAGLCDFYFENREVIRQANRVPEGTICSLNVDVLGDGRRLEQVPVILQYAGCAPGDEWITLTTVYTGIAEHAGSAEINFEFKESSVFCRYRVHIPSSAGNSAAANYPIDTFTEQEFFGKSK